MKTRVRTMASALCVATAMAVAMTADEPPAQATQPSALTPAPEKPASDKPVAQEPARPGVTAPGTEKFYRVLRSREGTWDVAASFWLVPGAEASQTRCTCTSRMILGGAYLEERIEGGTIKSEMGELPWSGLSHICYDAAQKKYLVNRMSSTCPTFMPESGTYDEEKRVFETTGEFTLMYMKVRVRTVTTQPGDDECVVEQYMSFNDSPEWKGIELRMTRRK